MPPPALTPSALTPSGTAFPADPWHQHDRRCYWDHTRCGWVCPPAPAAPPAADETEEAEVLAAPAPGLVPEPAT